MLKFEYPRPTKSGEKISKIWNELLSIWGNYKTARLENDIPKMRECATKIRILQDDLGITKADFPELSEIEVST
jgi:hypothetical protein